MKFLEGEVLEENFLRAIPKLYVQNLEFHFTSISVYGCIIYCITLCILPQKCFCRINGN